MYLYIHVCTYTPSFSQEFSLKLMEVVNESGGDFVWIHDYHLLVLPSLLRSKFNKVWDKQTHKHNKQTYHHHVPLSLISGSLWVVSPLPLSFL